MANEITVTSFLKVINGNLSWNSAQGSAVTQTFDQAVVGGPTPGMLTIGTTEESEAFSELTTEGWLWMKNLDTTNYIQWGFSTGVYGGRLEAGELALFRCEPGLTLYLKANTAACKLLLYCLED